jgi:SAM-dependent methyltransferase
MALRDPSQFDLHPGGDGDVLDLGCGSKKYPGAVGVDISADTDADIVHDLDVFPWPLQDNSFDHVLMQDVIEHVAEPYRVMAELHRICRPGARIQMRTPHFSSVLAYTDPTHKHYFAGQAMYALAEPGFEHYTQVRFRVVRVKLDLWAPYRVLGIGIIANRAMAFYEKYLAFRFTAMNIRAEFETIK